MKTIWKYTLIPGDTHKIAMPNGSQVLSVHEQHGDICIWAEVTPGPLTDIRKFVVIGTGHSFPAEENLKYLGQAVLAKGDLIFHVFEAK